MLNDQYMLGLDVGTQSLRAAVVDLTGRTKAFGVCPIETHYPQPGRAEQDPSQWWSAARQAVGKALNEAGILPEQVAGIGLDCTACTVVVCDLEGKPARPALLWMDQRAHAEAETISQTNDPVLRYV